MLKIFGRTQLLSAHEKSRSNNFTLLRLILAWLVLFGHAFPITGNGLDPISKLMSPHTWIGEVAVSGFFAISGYLVAASITNRSISDFCASRLLRIYPAIFVYSIIAVLIIGPLGADVSLEKYFDSNPWITLWNATLWEWPYNLPFVFVHHPLAEATNGSGWTLPGEIRCYLMVLALGFFGVFENRLRANIALLAILFMIYENYTGIPMFGGNARFASPLTFFIVGCLFWVNRKFIALNWSMAIVLAALTFVSAGIGYHKAIYTLSLVYIIFMVAYMAPAIDLDKFGDISYGVYIYAWPVQQLVWSQGQSAYMNTALSTIIVVVIAYASWRLVEKPALRLKRFFSWRPKLADRSASDLDKAMSEAIPESSMKRKVQ